MKSSACSIILNILDTGVCMCVWGEAGRERRGERWKGMGEREERQAGRGREEEAGRER